MFKVPFITHPAKSSGRWVITNTGLFLPRSRMIPKQPNDSASYIMSYWKVTLGLSNLRGTRQPFESIVESFRSYGLNPALNVLSRAEQLLRHAKHSEAMQVQQYIAKQFCSALTLDQVAQWIKLNAKTDEVRLFSEQQLLTGICLAVMYAKRKDRASLRIAPFTSLGIPLLSINDHLEPQIPEFNTDSQDIQKRFFAELILRNGLFNHRDDYRHHHTRHFEMFCEIGPSLHEHPQFIDLSQLHKRITGIKLSTFVSMGLALLSGFPVLTRENADTAPAAVLHDSLFPRKNLRRLSRKFIQEISTTRGRFRKSYQRDQLNSIGSTYNFMEIQRHPLLRIRGKRAFCLSRRFLVERIGVALHYRFLSTGSEAEKRRYLNFCGVMFEEYVRKICNRMYPDGRYISQIRYANNKEAADGWIIYPNSAIVLEAKASRFTLDVFLEGRFVGFEKKFRETILSGARQLDRVIRDFKSGSFTVNGFSASTLSVFYPIVVTQQYVPLDIYVSDYIRDGIRSENLLIAPGIQPLQIVHVEDLEHLEAIIATGASLLDMLKRRENNNVWRNWSFSNFLFEQFPGGLPQNEYIIAKYRELMSRTAWQLFGQRLK